MPENDPDGILIRKLKSTPDDRTFRTLLERHRNHVYNYCLRFLGNEAEAADCSQEIFIRVFLSINEFRFQSRFSTWLYRITLNHCLQMARSRNRRISGLRIESESGQESRLTLMPSPLVDGPEGLFVRKEIQAAFQSALGRLKDIQRTMVILKDLDGLSYEEISAITGKKPGTVRSTLSRARFRIARELKIYHDEMQ